MRIFNNMPVSNNLNAKQTAQNNNDALQKAIKEMGLRETSAQGVYCEQHNPNMPKGIYTNQRHYVWNETTQQMEELPGIYFITSSGNDRNGSTICNAALQSRLQGYEFTDTEGIYSKNGKFYKYNDQTNCFEEIVNNNDNNNDTTFDGNNKPSVVDLYEEIVNDEVESKSNKLPQKEVASEERTEYSDGSYSLAQFDEDGNIIGETIYNTDGSVKSTYSYEYYDDGSSKHIRKDANGTITDINIIDSQKRNVGYEAYNDGELSMKETVKFNDDGSYTRIRDEYWDNSHKHTINKYDANQNLISSTSTLPDGTETNTKCYNYDDGTYLQIETNETGDVYSINASDGESPFAICGFYNIDKCKELITDTEKSIQDTQLAYTYLDLPFPPDPNIITDPVEYDLAMKEYNEDKQHYDEECQKLNEKLNSLDFWLKNYRNTLQVIEFLGFISENELNIADLRANGESVAADKIQEDLDKLTEAFTHNFIEKSKNNWEIHELNTERNSDIAPKVPSRADFYVNGYFDELNYNKAILEYRDAKKEYDAKQTELERKLVDANQKDANLNANLNNINKGLIEYNTNININARIIEYDDNGKEKHEYIVYNDGRQKDSYFTYENGKLTQMQETTHYPDGSKIIHECTLNDNGNNYDLYYTYENDVLTQTQETIHYPDGNYTYIFRDADGNLKEEQKVIHNELGGITFDCTYADGRREVSVSDANDKHSIRTYYSSEGKIEKIEECSYDTTNPNICTITEKNAEGKIIRKEQWEKYTYTDKDGNVWHGSHVINLYKYDENENLTGYEEYLCDQEYNNNIEIIYDANGNIINYITKKHDDDGRFISVTTYDFNENGKIVNGNLEGVIATHQDRYIHDDEGRTKEIYTINSDGSTSNLYFTYEDGKLTQTQETIHYPDGNYTYIFRDADGNLKEEQKVIHNELGGTTHDCTYADGTRHVHVYDANDKPTITTYYSSEGNVEKTEECSFDATNPNVCTITERNAEGKIIGQQKWENYTLTDKDGNTWHGSHIINLYKYDENENIIGYEEHLHDRENNKDTIIAYDANGNIAQYTNWQRDNDGRLISITIYDFNENGRIVNGNPEGAFVKHQYWYDEEGNVIKEEHDKI